MYLVRPEREQPTQVCFYVRPYFLSLGMTYHVIALRYRPRRFDEVVGQEETANTLKQAVQGGRLAHAYLFAGPRGV